MIDRSDIINTYLKATSIWPQKRWAIHIYILHLVIHSPDPVNTLSQILNLSFSKEEYKRIFDIMSCMHTKAEIDRVFTYRDIDNDWSNAIGAMFRSLLYFSNGKDPLHEKNYFALLPKDSLINKNELFKSALYQGSVFSEAITKTFHALEREKKLSYLFRFTLYSDFYKQKELNTKEASYIRYSNRYFGKDISRIDTVDSRDIWNKLGIIIFNKLYKDIDRNNLIWLTWGFHFDVILEEQS